MIANRGIKDSQIFNYFVSCSNVSTLCFIIITGFFYVNFDNMSNFFSKGSDGILAGSWLAFFAYSGF